MLSLSEARAGLEDVLAEKTRVSVKRVKEALVAARAKELALDFTRPVTLQLTSSAGPPCVVSYMPDAMLWSIVKGTNQICDSVFRALQVDLSRNGWLIFHDGHDEYATAWDICVAPIDNLRIVHLALKTQPCVTPEFEAVLDALVPGAAVLRETVPSIREEFARGAKSFAWSEQRTEIHQNVLDTILTHRAFRAYPSALRSEFLWAIVHPF
jgi:hypothetical protein